MDDPELQSDETILVRTPGIFVKSIPFEGILTDKRIILVDRAKNLLPPKEIPLATIKELEPGENAIRDQTITLSVLANNNVTRQVILTFSRATGGTRLKERDEWVRQIRAHTSSTFGQSIRKVIPGREPAQKKTEGAPTRKIEIVGSPVVSIRPVKTDTDSALPDTKPPESSPQVSSQSPVTPQVSFGTFCTRCGNQVPDGSAFCNRCGNKIVRPVDTSPGPATTTKERSVDLEIQPAEPPTERPVINIPRDPLPTVPPAQEPVFPKTSSGVAPPRASPAQATPAKKPKARRLLPRLFSPKPAPTGPSPKHTADPLKPRRGKGIFIAIGIIVIIVIAVVAGVFLFLKPQTSAVTGSGTPSPSSTQAPAGTVSAAQTALPLGTIVVQETKSVTIPATGVYLHVNYIGGWNGTYGLPAAQVKVTNSGDRVIEVVNATGTVQASIQKQDRSAKEILVEIYKDGKQLTSGVTSTPAGKVTLSVDTTSGVAQAPVIS